MILPFLLFFSAPALAEGDFEMFYEVCEVTGELRPVRLRDINISEALSYNEVKDLSEQ